MPVTQTGLGLPLAGPNAHPKSMREVTDECNRQAARDRASEQRAAQDVQARVKADPDYLTRPSKIKFEFTPGYGRY